MLWNVFLIVFFILFVLYVIFSLSTIKFQLNLISKHLNIEEQEIRNVSNEEIEKELEEDLKN